MTQDTPDRGRWPEWLTALLPDDVARRRVRRAIIETAAPLLAVRRSTAWEEIAARWSTLLVPVAAALALAFGGLAYQASAPTPMSVTAEPQPTSLEELFATDPLDGPPRLLTGDVEPSKELVLAAAMQEGSPVPARDPEDR